MPIGSFICDATDGKWSARLYEGGAVVFQHNGNYAGGAHYDRDGLWTEIYFKVALGCLPRLDLLAFEFSRYPRKAHKKYPPWPKDEPGLTREDGLD